MPPFSFFVNQVVVVFISQAFSLQRDYLTATSAKAEVHNGLHWTPAFAGVTGSVGESDGLREWRQSTAGVCLQPETGSPPRFPAYQMEGLSFRSCLSGRKDSCK